MFLASSIAWRYELPTTHIAAIFQWNHPISFRFRSEPVTFRQLPSPVALVTRSGNALTRLSIRQPARSVFQPHY